MKVGLNLLGLPTLRQGGAGLLAGLEAKALASDPAVRLRVLCEGAVGAELLSAGIPGIEAVSGTQQSGWLSGVRSGVRELRSPFNYRDQGVPRDALGDSEVVHYPLSFFAGPDPRVATLVTAVDLQHLHFPEFFSRKDRTLRALRWHRSIRRATRVAVYSRFAKSSLIERLGISPERIDVVGACCNEVFFSDDPGRPPDDAPLAPFLLYPASPLPAKNHELLLEAFSRVARAVGDLRLVLVGPLTHDWQRVKAAAADHGVTDRTLILGHVSLRELVWLYGKAEALIFPSRFEGFGIPVLEAMAVGCPVAASNATSIPEVAGEAGILFDPTDAAQISAAIEHAVTMPEQERAAMKSSGKDRALQFRPEVMTRKLLRSMAAATAERQR